MHQDQTDQGVKAAGSAAGEFPPRPPRAPAASAWRRWRPFLLAAALLIAAAAALAVDCPLAQWCRTHDCPSELRNLLSVCEPFGNGAGVLVIALVIHQLDPVRRWALPRILACSWGSGLAANLIKLLIVRVRPRAFDFHGNVWATFGGWFPGTRAGYSGQSFPSAHVATAVGLALALIWLYPTGRKLFPAMVVLVAGHRIEAEAHYLSDVLCGAALGVLVASACLGTGLLGMGFDRLEGYWRSHSGPPAASPNAPPQC
jgi:membrane-associated phospholipid phosphatase